MKLKHGTGHRDKLADRVCVLVVPLIVLSRRGSGPVPRRWVVPRSDHPCGCENPLLSPEFAGSPLCGGDGPMVLRFTPLVGAEAMQRSKEGQLGE
ncbi:hypothetical protein GE21DRAFT_1195596, partial [Neurospora crassa]